MSFCSCAAGWWWASVDPRLLSSTTNGGRSCWRGGAVLLGALAWVASGFDAVGQVVFLGLGFEMPGVDACFVVALVAKH